ncbi:S-adenosyl-L-methionine-dependent methyltransferase [Tuber indicum]|nr:S-adenosyl-L-methionine-dependent methyltransferase [Tuber indicum]
MGSRYARIFLSQILRIPVLGHFLLATRGGSSPETFQCSSRVILLSFKSPVYPTLFKRLEKPRSVRRGLFGSVILPPSPFLFFFPLLCPSLSFERCPSHPPTYRLTQALGHLPRSWGRDYFFLVSRSEREVVLGKNIRLPESCFCLPPRATVEEAWTKELILVSLGWCPLSLAPKTILRPRMILSPFRRAYYAPNDENQNNQLDIFHHIYLLLLGGDLYIAPIERPKRILDVGTGTGIWAMDIADKFPDAEVDWIDLSPIQPEWVPPNVHFEIDDAESPWTYPEGHFDFIHIRCLFGAISDWPALLEQCYKYLAPGGWVEVVEMKLPYDCDDETLARDSHLYKWCEYTLEAGKESGRRFDITGEVYGWLGRAGFTDLRERNMKVPIGPWSKDPKEKEVGKYNLLNLLEGMDGFTTALLTRHLGWKPIEVQAFYGGIRREATDPRIHSYFRQYYWAGQKPIRTA